MGNKYYPIKVCFLVDKTFTFTLTTMKIAVAPVYLSVVTDLNMIWHHFIVTISTMIEDIIIYNKMQKLIENEQYWSSYGSASFGSETRRAISNFAKP